MTSDGQRSQYLWSGLKMDEDEIKEFVKQMHLQKGHYYIILTDVGDDKFKMSAYDTTGNKYETEMDHTVGSVMHEVLLGYSPGKLKRCLTLVCQSLHTTTPPKEYLVR